MWGWIKLNIVLFVISNLYIAAAKLQLFFDICKSVRDFCQIKCNFSCIDQKIVVFAPKIDLCYEQTNVRHHTCHV